MAWTRNCLALGLALGLVACGDDGDSQPTSGSTSNETADAGTVDDTGMPTGSNPVDCVPGQLDCTCPCIGGTYCVDDICVLGPEINVGENRAVLPGVLVPHEVTVMAEEFSWSQESGPQVEILGAETQNIAVAVPPDMAPGDSIRLRLTASRNGVTLEDFWEVTALAPQYDNALPGINDPAQLGTTEGITIGPMGLYVVSTEGFISLFNENGEFVESYDMGGSPVGANFMGENLIVANAGLGTVQRLNSVSGNITELFAMAGQANYPLVDANNNGEGNVFVSTRLDQSILFYNGETGTASSVFNDPAVVNPNALAFGPEGNTIYVGGVGHVWRVPLLDGGGTGDPEDYLDLGNDGCEVDGLAFDEGNNMWVGCPGLGTLFVAQYSAMGPTQISRAFDGAPGDLSGFVSLRFGGGDFDDLSLYYTNLDGGTVGRLRVGLGR